jgi:hypothetical protein
VESVVDHPRVVESSTGVESSVGLEGSVDVKVVSTTLEFIVLEAETCLYGVSSV